MTTRQKINQLEPWDQGLAESMLEERGMWLENAIGVCIRVNKTRGEAVEQLAESMEDSLQAAVDKLCRSTPLYILSAMDGFCQLDPSLCFECIADALMEDYWPEGKPKPSMQGASMNRRPTARGPGTSGSKSRKAPAKKMTPAKKPANRRY